MSKEFCVYVELTAKPKMDSALAEALQSLARASLATEFCSKFEVVQHSADPSRFTLFEVFSSSEIYPTHVATDHAQDFLKRVIPELVADRSVIFLEKTTLTS